MRDINFRAILKNEKIFRNVTGIDFRNLNGMS